jgi:hypothetical protein
MLLYKDVLSGDEMLSDSYDVNEQEIFLEVAGKWVTTGDISVDIGANASAEEAPEELESAAKKVVDIVDAFRLQETSWDKKGFMGYIKLYMKAVAEKLSPERKEAFMAAAPAAVKELLGRFSELQFFTGETGDLEASLAYAYYKEGATDPTFLFFKDGLKEVKC